MAICGRQVNAARKGHCPVDRFQPYTLQSAFSIAMTATRLLGNLLSLGGTEAAAGRLHMDEELLGEIRDDWAELQDFRWRCFANGREDPFLEDYVRDDIKRAAGERVVEIPVSYGAENETTSVTGHEAVTWLAWRAMEKTELGAAQHGEFPPEILQAPACHFEELHGFVRSQIIALKLTPRESVIDGLGELAARIRQEHRAAAGNTDSENRAAAGSTKIE
jgi:hypothetical protein